MAGKLEGKVAIITGASRGIGAGMARTYAKYGAKLVLAARSDKVCTFADELTAAGVECIAAKTDVTNVASVDALIAVTLETYGHIDILCCNAGVCDLVDFLDERSAASRDYHIDVNIKGPWNVCYAVLPLMIERDFGKIVITSSVTGDMVADPGEVAYATSKAALIGFTKALAREVASHNITVNAICPGIIDTDMIASMAKTSCPENPQSVIDPIEAAIPLGRMGRPEEVGELAAFLGCDTESSYLTGAQFVIDGGSTLPETMNFSS